MPLRFGLFGLTYDVAQVSGVMKLWTNAQTSSEVDRRSRTRTIWGSWSDVCTANSEFTCTTSYSSAAFANRFSPYEDVIDRLRVAVEVVGVALSFGQGLEQGVKAPVLENLDGLGKSPWPGVELVFACRSSNSRRGCVVAKPPYERNAIHGGRSY